MLFYATLKPAVLEKIYELTYKYGWLKHDESILGWLPDNAYKAKYQIEGTLAKYLAEGYKELIAVYTTWLAEHSHEGWITDKLAKLSEGLFTVFDRLDSWAIPYERKVYEIVERALGGSLEMIQKEPDDKLAATYGSQFLEYFKTTIPEASAQALDQHLEKLEYEHTDAQAAAAQVVLENDLVDDLRMWVVNELGWEGRDQIEKAYQDDFPALLNTYGDAIADYLPEILDYSYDSYLEYFTEPQHEGGKSLVDEITDAEEMLSRLVAGQYSDMGDRIVLFQEGLTTAHHHGTMADHLLGVAFGGGKELLDLLSNSPEAEEWDKELTQVLGHPPGGIQKEVPVSWVDPEKDYTQLLRTNGALKLAALLTLFLSE